MQVVIALGSNLGESVTTLEEATKEIAALKGVTLIAKAQLYRTKPWGYLDQPDFVNSALLVATTRELHDLYQELYRLELEFGRKRLFKNGPRTLDLDIIWAEDTMMSDEVLIIPHPRAQERAFVLVPMSDLGQDLRFPDTGKTVKEAIAQLPQSELDGITLLFSPTK